MEIRQVVAVMRQVVQQSPRDLPWHDFLVRGFVPGELPQRWQGAKEHQQQGNDSVKQSAIHFCKPPRALAWVLDWLDLSAGTICGVSIRRGSLEPRVRH